MSADPLAEVLDQAGMALGLYYGRPVWLYLARAAREHIAAEILDDLDSDEVGSQPGANIAGRMRAARIARGQA